MFGIFIISSIIFILTAATELDSKPRQQQQSSQKRTIDGAQEGGIKVRDCEPISTPLCSDLGYHTTGMPNVLGHQTTEDAIEQLATFKSLFQYEGIGLEPRFLHFFFCSTYLPMCTEKYKDPIGPCRPLCELVKDRCEPILKTFGFNWPVGLNCSLFRPSNEEDGMCMNPGVSGAEDPPPGDDIWPPASVRPSHSPSTPPIGSNWGNIVEKRGDKTSCNHMNQPENFVIINSTRTCALRCHTDAAFTSSDKHFSEIWLLVCSAVSFILSLITIFSFMIASSRFTYPERTIFLIAFCNVISCTACFIRLTAGRTVVACQGSLETDGRMVVEVLVQGGLENSNCTIVFILTYYFSMAAAAWWVILTVTWALVAGRAVTIEALSRYSTLYHIIAWALPSIPTVVILILRSVDADELTGMCLVGNWNRLHLLTLIIAPLCLYLSLGVIGLSMGAISLYRAASQDRSPTNTPKLPVKRLAVFAIIFAVSQAWVLAIACYEYSNRQNWYLSGNGSETLPTVAILHLKLFCRLSVGIICFATVCSKETVRSWITSCSRFLRLCSSSSSSSSSNCCNITTETDKSSVTLLNKNVHSNFTDKRTPTNVTTSFSYRSDPVRTGWAGPRLSKSVSIGSKTDTSSSIYRSVPQHAAGYQYSRTMSNEVAQDPRYFEQRRSVFEGRPQNQIYTVSR